MFLFFPRLLIAIIWLMTASASVIAAQPSAKPVPPPNDAVADAAAEKIQAVYRGTATLRFNFTQDTRVELLGRAIYKKGEMWFKRPGKFYIHYTTPPLKDYISDGKRLWIALPEESKVYQTALKKDEIDEQARIFLEGLGNLKESFLISAMSKQQELDAMIQDKTSIKLQLIPRKESDFFVWIAIAVNASTYQVEEMTLFNYSQNVSHYVFSHIQLNPEIGDDKFALKKEWESLVQKQ